MFGWKVKIAEVYRVKVGLGGRKFSHFSGYYSRIFAWPLKIQPSQIPSVFIKADYVETDVGITSGGLPA
jgi:hypothetical protein